MTRGSKVLAATEFRWPVALKPYKEGGDLFRDVTRQTLLGEGEGEEALAFLTRYFEVGEGGFSTLEQHKHPHAVVILRGRGTVQLGERTFAIGPSDCVYVAPGELHQFRADQGEALGFLCIVDRDRDRPVPVQPLSPLPPA
ncbi:MAG: cupin domain-containing protein [Thermoanaerobaculia bacterium]